MSGVLQSFTDMEAHELAQELVLPRGGGEHTYPKYLPQCKKPHGFAGLYMSGAVVEPQASVGEGVEIHSMSCWENVTTAMQNQTLSPLPLSEPHP